MTCERLNDYVSQLANDFRTDFENLIRDLEEKVDRLANFKVDLCIKIDQVHIELKKLKKGAILMY